MISGTIGHYRILQKLGEGGMGVVYRAHDEQLDRDVAIKVLPAASFRDASARARLLREARAAAALNHPNICTIHEVGEAEGQAYIAMELVQGEPLSARLARGPVLPDEVLRYGLQLADALAHAHERNIIHRDLKSANVIITPEGRAKVLDFGLAKRMIAEELAEAATLSGTEATLTRPGAVVGTLAYMAPEQLRGQVADARSDIWALGVVLHEMAAGGRPFQGKTGFDLSSAILTQPPAPLPEDVRPEVKAVIGRCLEKEPTRRYQRASELRAAIEAVLSGTATVPVVSRPISRRWLLAAFGSVVVAFLAVLLALNAGGLRDRLLGRAGAQRIQSLAVLPLENLSRDPEQDYLVEGMHEALITDLAKLGVFKKVIARSSVQRYRRSDKPLPQIGRELGVDAVITGSVQRSGDRVSITAQLINAATEENLWADRYERQLRDILTVQNEIVTAITRGIKLRLTPQQQARLASARPVNPEAHEAYLKGMFYVNKMTPEGMEKGLAHLQQAIDKDPADALAYAGLALAYSEIGHTPAAPPDTLAKAKAAALKALELDPAAAEAQEALAEVRAYSDRDYDWPATEQAYRRALELNPGLPQAHGHYGWYLHLFGRNEEAMVEMKRAVELAPLDPLYTAWVGEHHMEAGRLDQAAEQFRKALELDPQFPVALADLGVVYTKKGMYKEAIASLEKAKAVSPDFGYGLAIAYAKAGRKEDARKVLAELEKGGNPWNTWGIAEIYTSFGEKDKAFQWLETAYKQRHPYIPWLRSYPGFAPLRGDPRFKDLLARMNLKPQA